MKRLISIIFLSLLIMKIGGYFAFLTFQQNNFREEAKERILHLLPTNKQTKLIFSTKQFNEIDWAESNKEFYFQERLYDVVNIKVEGNNHIIYCIADENETEVYAQILQMSKVQNDELPVKNNMISFLNLLTLKYTLPQILYFEYIINFEVKKSVFATLVAPYFSVIISIFIPPPEL